MYLYQNALQILRHSYRLKPTVEGPLARFLFTNIVKEFRFRAYFIHVRCTIIRFLG